MDIDEDSSMDVNPTTMILATPTEEQDTLSPLAEVDTDMNDDTKSIHSRRSQAQKGVRIDDHYYFPDTEPEEIKKKTSNLNDYQKAWNISDSDDESNDEEDEMEIEDISDSESNISYHDEEQSEMGDTASEMHVDLSPEEEARQ